MTQLVTHLLRLLDNGQGLILPIDFSTFKGNYLWHTCKYRVLWNSLRPIKVLLALPEFWDQQYASTPFRTNKHSLQLIGSSAGVRHNVPPIDDNYKQPVF